MNTGQDFKSKVLELCSKIPEGKVTTYGEISRALGTSPRPIGGALKKNENAPVIPCHRVVKSNGTIGGYSGKDPKNIKKKIKLLETEGVFVRDNKIVDFEKILYKFE